MDHQYSQIKSLFAETYHWLNDIYSVFKDLSLSSSWSYCYRTVEFSNLFGNEFDS